MVNDVYPSDCITYRFLVNPNQQLYRVKGHQQSEIIQRPSSPVSSSSASLVLKPAKGKLVQHPQTPCRAEESEQLLMYQQRARIVAEQGTSTKLSKYTQDVLDEAIEEVKEFRDLVSAAQIMEALRTDSGLSHSTLMMTALQVV